MRALLGHPPESNDFLCSSETVRLHAFQILYHDISLQSAPKKEKDMQFQYVI